MSTILLIEDDKKLRGELEIFLKKYGFSCEITDDYENAAHVAAQCRPDMVLLDVNLPMTDGYQICRKIRQSSDMPIIIVTSRDTQTDELLSMEFGADDFVTKPYNPQILLARIRAVLKRANRGGMAAIEHRGLELDVLRGVARMGEQEAELSKNELGILRLLMENRDRVVSRGDIMNELWQTDEFIDDNTLTVNINRLRKKLESIGAVDYLATKRGRGYMV